jgi:SAM-dependent methyltransferase
LVDLGCGRGILLALLSAPVEDWRNARPHSESARAVRVRHVAPPGMQFIGLELDARLARVARRALAGAATIEQANLVDCPIPSCATAVLLDVLHYMPATAQEDLLDRVAAALGPRGVLLLREADRDAGFGFRFTAAAERLRAVARGRFRQRFCFRSQAEWEELLRRRGLRVEALPVAEGSLFANVVLVAHQTGG